VFESGRIIICKFVLALAMLFLQVGIQAQPVFDLQAHRGGLDVGANIVGGRNSRNPNFPQLTIGGNALQVRLVLEAQRDQSDAIGSERNGSDEGHGFAVIGS